MTSQEEKTDFVTAPPIQKEVDNSASNLYLLRHPREDKNTNRQRINAKLLKIGVLGVNNVGNKSEDQVMDALLKAKVVRLDNKMIPESYPSDLPGVRRENRRNARRRLCCAVKAKEWQHAGGACCR